MKIEEEIFYGYELDESKLIHFGFNLEKDIYSKSYPILNNDFSVIVNISKDNKVIGKVIDNNFNVEYTLFRNEIAVGSFVGSIREEFTKILSSIRKKCFKKVLFPDPQAVRISNYIYKTYGDKPDFPWSKYPYYGVFRHKDNNRW